MSETYYVLDKFAQYDTSLKSIIEALPIKRNAIDRYMQKNKVQRAKDTYADLVVLKKKLIDIVRNLQLLFSEVDMTEGAEFSKKLFVAVTRFNLTTPDYSKLLNAISALENYIPQTEKANASVIGHLMNNVKMGYYPTDLEHVQKIKNALKFPDVCVNLFDPCCGEGFALELLGEDKNCITFGTEIDEIRGKESETRIDRVGFGSYFYSSIRSEAFHAILLNPPYLNVIGENGVKARSEKRFLVESMHHLMDRRIANETQGYYSDFCRKGYIFIHP